MITVYLNKTAILIKQNTTLLNAIHSKLPHTNTVGIAVALNEKIIPTAVWESIQLKENDQIIIIKATQGG